MNVNNDYIDTYITALRSNSTDANEHTHRTALENLLHALQANPLIDAPPMDDALKIIHEPKREAGFGAPDFALRKHGQYVGYIETKQIGADLKKVLASEQIKKYCALSDNLIVTDYLRFIWLKDGEIADDITLMSAADLQQAGGQASPDAMRDLSALICKKFFSNTPPPIGTVNGLATGLAMRGKILRDFFGESLANYQRERLYGIYEVFRNNVSDHLATAQFADAFAQMLSYGLFLAKLNADDKNDHTPITLNSAKTHITENFALIKELVGFLDELEKPLYAKIGWVVKETLTIINRLDLHEIKKELSFDGSKDDPYIYFYEDFLRAWDKATRKSRGVYYTPPAVVKFITGAIDDILRKDFEVSNGLGEIDKVTALDFATGTGTFLLDMFQQVLDNSNEKMHSSLIKEHFLKNFYGFEFLLAPYAVAHLKLSRFLRHYGYDMDADERLQIYLSNTLEQSSPQGNLLLPALSYEGETAYDIKANKRILVIAGNPPYAVNSMNQNEWIGKLIDDYKYIDGKPLGERNSKTLQDDYVKFIRFAQHKMDAMEEGIVGVITNHGYLDNVTFRGMRQSLMQSFDRIYLLDLHGNANKQEIAPDGSKDENVFDIKQGVAIAIFEKRKGLKKGIFHANIYGAREDKYQQLMQGFQHIKWQELQPQSPDYFFVPQDTTLKPEYQQGIKLTNIFPIYNGGIKTHRDEFAFAFSKQEMQARITDILGMKSDKALQDEYQLKDTDDWQFAAMRDAMRHTQDEEMKKKIVPCLYRPFDNRYCYYGTETMTRPRGDIMHHMLAGENMALITSRTAYTQQTWADIQVTNKITEFGIMATRPGNSAPLFPLYLYPPTEGAKTNKKIRDLFDTPDPFALGARIENIAPEFRKFLGVQYPNLTITPEQIMGYCYAILHSHSYRIKYADFLKRDFPHIPFVQDSKQFLKLSEIGQKLIDTHLMKQVPPFVAKLAGKSDDFTVTRPHYDKAQKRLYINNAQYFEPVPSHVWEFYIGGYQVLDKYLKSRKNRTLSLAEIQHIQKIIGILDFTTQQMSKIEKIYQA